MIKIQTIDVLLIEDNMADALLLKSSLEEDLLTEFSISHAKLLKEGLECLKNGEFGAVMLDLGLPDSLGMNSFDKIHEYYPDIPIIVFSGNENENQAIEAVRAGAQDYLVKSLNGFKMAARTIRYAIERQQIQKKLRESESRYRLIAENTDDVIWMIDPESNNFTYVSPSVKKLRGYSPEEIMSKPFFDSLTPESAREVQQFLELRLPIARKEGNLVHRVEVDQPHRDGSIVKTEVTVTYTINNDDKLFIIGVSRNITERKKVENELRESEEKYRLLSIELEKRIEERTSKLTETNTALEKASRAKDEFLANMSHELRTPLNSILGLSESLLEQYIGSLNEKQSKAIQIIRDSGNHLLALINDILDLTKIESGNEYLDISTFDVTSICEASITFIKQLAHKKNLVIRTFIDPNLGSIQADARRLKQMLVNLLNNAVKFTERGSVELKVIRNTESKTIQFSITDTGIGISENHLDKLFKPFIQLDSGLSREFEGTGLGLALVSRLAKMHGGSVSIESKPGKGSCFSFTIPLVEANTNPVESPVSSSNEFESKKNRNESFRKNEFDTNSKKILIVEDNESNIMTLSVFLESYGYVYEVARSGLEALEKLQNVLPGLILMDLQMPVMDGLETIKQIRSNPKGEIANIPIIAISAHAMKKDKTIAIEAGANFYISKPLNIIQLKEKILFCLLGKTNLID
ncbi:MAG: response regulator [Leptospiraceae bacterium]|nr:response regulator [Leptospiraceae bacterium]